MVLNSVRFADHQITISLMSVHALRNLKLYYISISQWTGIAAPWMCFFVFLIGIQGPSSTMPQILESFAFLNSDLALNEIYENNKITFSLNEIHIFVNFSKMFFFCNCFCDGFPGSDTLTDLVWAVVELGLGLVFLLLFVRLADVHDRVESIVVAANLVAADPPRILPPVTWHEQKHPNLTSCRFMGSLNKTMTWHGHKHPNLTSCSLMGSPNKTTTWHDDLTRTQTSKSDTM